MLPVVASAIAVLGTLLGSTLTYVFQRRTQELSNQSLRREARRKEFSEAVAKFASTATTLRRAEFDRARKRIERADESVRDEARQETYRLRAETRSAYYVLALLADPVKDKELVERAERFEELARQITSGPATLEEIRQRSTNAAEALSAIVAAANLRLQGEPS